MSFKLQFKQIKCPPKFHARLYDFRMVTVVLVPLTASVNIIVQHHKIRKCRPSISDHSNLK